VKSSCESAPNRCSGSSSFSEKILNTGSPLGTGVLPRGNGSTIHAGSPSACVTADVLKNVRRLPLPG
jgi:hypothetical protein